MITAYLVGNQQLLERLQALPGIVNSGLVRGITQLGIDLQRAVKRDARRDQPSRRSTRGLASSADLRIEQSGPTITASACLDSHNAVRKDGVAGTTNVRASLRRKREVFLSPSAPKAAGALAGDGVPGLVEPSFLRSALDNMTSTVRDEIDATLAQAISQ
jgi:hypothetical protein